MKAQIKDIDNGFEYNYFNARFWGIDLYTPSGEIRNLKGYLYQEDRDAPLFLYTTDTMKQYRIWWSFSKKGVLEYEYIGPYNVSEIMGIFNDLRYSR